MKWDKLFWIPEKEFGEASSTTTWIHSELIQRFFSYQY